ncbi:MAG: cyclic nucleotide-binding domain-containing protein [Thermoleophilaceae bacterium]|nr:cyclic nucleotide-binding domain-containing protein [Thermoleophilaceae bacterium]
MDTNRLKNVPLFADIPAEQLEAIAPFATILEVSPGKNLVDEGDYSYEFMAIEDGTAEVTRDGETLAELGPGDFFGEMGLLSKDRRNATVTAKTPMRLVTLSSWDLKRLQKNAPQAAQAISDAAKARSEED